MYIFKYPEFAQALYESLNADPFYVAMLQPLSNDANSKADALIRYLDYSMAEAETYGKLFIPEHHQYGVSIWTKPLTPDLELKRNAEKKAFIKHYMGNESLSIYTTITSFMSAQTEGLIPDDAWYLSILGVTPQFQGKGLGTGLVSGVLQETDKCSTFTYLETFNAASINFYKKLGYEISRRIEEPVTQSPYWILVRGL